MTDPLTAASTALDVVNKGVQTVRLILRPRADVTVVEGGFAKCLPDGVSDADLDGGIDSQMIAVTSEYHGETQRDILGDTLGGFLGAEWKWRLVFTWKSNVRDRGRGAYILDASVDVTSETASDQIAWEWKATFPGKGRWHDREAGIAELPFKLNIKCTHSLIYDKLWWEHTYRGWLRGDGSALCAPV